jgi:hypothetical protein
MSHEPQRRPDQRPVHGPVCTQRCWLTPWWYALLLKRNQGQDMCGRTRCWQESISNTQLPARLLPARRPCPVGAALEKNPVPATAAHTPTPCPLSCPPLSCRVARSTPLAPPPLGAHQGFRGSPCGRKAAPYREMAPRGGVRLATPHDRSPCKSSDSEALLSGHCSSALQHTQPLFHRNTPGHSLCRCSSPLARLLCLCLRAIA